MRAPMGNTGGGPDRSSSSKGRGPGTRRLQQGRSVLGLLRGTNGNGYGGRRDRSRHIQGVPGPNRRGDRVQRDVFGHVHGRRLFYWARGAIHAGPTTRGSRRGWPDRPRGRWVPDLALEGHWHEGRRHEDNQLEGPTLQAVTARRSGTAHRRRPSSGTCGSPFNPPRVASGCYGHWTNKWVSSYRSRWRGMR